MHLFPKVNRAQMPQQKCHVSMLDRAHGYMQRVGTGSVITRIVWAPGKLDETGTQAKWSWKAEKFQRKNCTVVPVSVYLGHLWLFLMLPMHRFRVIKGKEKKQITFLYISLIVFLGCKSKQAKQIQGDLRVLPHSLCISHWTSLLR